MTSHLRSFKDLVFYYRSSVVISQRRPTSHEICGGKKSDQDTKCRHSSVQSLGKKNPDSKPYIAILGKEIGGWLVKKGFTSHVIRQFLAISDVCNERMMYKLVKNSVTYFMTTILTNLQIINSMFNLNYIYIYIKK